MRTELDPATIASFAGQKLAVDVAMEAYDAAVVTVAGRLTARAGAASGAVADVLAANVALVRDPGLRGEVESRLAAGDDLLAALAAAVDRFVATFTDLGGVMAERTTDLRDIERRLVAELVGAPEPGIPGSPRPSVLIADDLAPSDTAGLRPESVVALVTERGGPTSHTAIIARQLGIPCVVAVAGVMSVPPGTPVLVDGSTGAVTAAPDEATAREQVHDAARLVRERADWTGPGQTDDGHRVRLLANVSDAESARQAAGGPAEGVGLFRTELCFLDRAQEPTVAEQSTIYAEVLRAFGARRDVVIRTLDAGSDKPITFAGLRDEENPALGIRGLRLSFDDPGPLDRQLEAIATAARTTGTSPRVMAPTVATVGEARTFADKVRAVGLEPGIMIEVPGAALLARNLLELVDFVSIGTNDLAQYTMAADRAASGLAHLTDPWQPAVLALVALVAEAGRATNKPVGVCGEAAADPALATALAGMGITSLSMAPAALAAVGRQLSSVSMATCEEAAEAVLAQSDPAAGRDAVREVLSR